MSGPFEVYNPNSTNSYKDFVQTAEKFSWIHIPNDDMMRHAPLSLKAQPVFPLKQNISLEKIKSGSFLV